MALQLQGRCPVVPVGKAAVMQIAPTVKSILLPRYDVAQRLLCTLSGTARSTVTGLIRWVYLWSGTADEQSGPILPSGSIAS